MKNTKPSNERGAVIVEATFVFPLMIVILFFLIYMGNAYYAKAQVEAVVTRNAIIGANYCADPLLETLLQENQLPSYDKLDLDPYRHIFGGASAVEKKIDKQIRSEIGNKNTNSFFNNMRPKIRKLSVEYKNRVIYANFVVQLDYEIRFPISFLGSSETTVLKISSCAIAPVNDTAEFIRTTDMVIDYFGENPMVKKIQSYFGKINELLGTFAGK